MEGVLHMAPYAHEHAYASGEGAYGCALSQDASRQLLTQYAPRTKAGAGGTGGAGDGGGSYWPYPKQQVTLAFAHFGLPHSSSNANACLVFRDVCLLQDMVASFGSSEVEEASHEASAEGEPLRVPALDDLHESSRAWPWFLRGSRRVRPPCNDSSVETARLFLSLYTLEHDVLLPWLHVSACHSACFLYVLALACFEAYFEAYFEACVEAGPL